MKMWETKCVGCGKMTPANQCPQVGHQAPDGSWVNSLCKPCWIESKKWTIKLLALTLSGVDPS